MLCLVEQCGQWARYFSTVMIHYPSELPIITSVPMYSISHIERYFHGVLNAIVNPAFYNSVVHLATTNTPPSSTITNNPKLSPFFDNAVGCLDSSYIPACPDSND
jgi:hypothetical protein